MNTIELRNTFISQLQDHYEVVQSIETSLLNALIVYSVTIVDLTVFIVLVIFGIFCTDSFHSKKSVFFSSNGVIISSLHITYLIFLGRSISLINSIKLHPMLLDPLCFDNMIYNASYKNIIKSSEVIKFASVSMGSTILLTLLLIILILILIK